MRTEADADPEVRFASFERRWDLAWSLIPYVLLPLASVIAMITGPPVDWGWVIMLGLTVVGIGWHFWFITRHPQWPERRLLPMAIYFLGLLALAVGLTLLHPAQLLVVLGCFVVAFVALPRGWAYLAVGVTGVACLGLAGGPGIPLSLALQIVGLTIFAAAIGMSIRWVEREARRRMQAHAELSSTHEELSRAHQELIRLSAEKRRLDAELIKAAEETGIVRERARMARDIHDTHAQHLIGIAAQLEAAAEQLDPDHPAGPRIRAALELSRTGLVDARRAMQALRPPDLEGRDLPDAVRAVVASWRRFHRLPVEVTIDGSPVALPQAVEETAVRVIGEALANVARHAAASRADVTLSYLDDVLAVDIRDDGIGFDPGSPLPSPPPGGAGGFGLRAMRERVAESGGELAVESAPGQGTVVAATLPVTGEQRRNR